MNPIHTSQCGRTIASLALTAALIRDLLSDEDRGMLAAIAADYLEQFGEMPPKSGVFHDTQTEENAWTALGLASSLTLLPNHPRRAEWWETAAASRPSASSRGRTSPSSASSRGR